MNPGPLAPEAKIIPLDQQAATLHTTFRSDLFINCVLYMGPRRFMAWGVIFA